MDKIFTKSADIFRENVNRNMPLVFEGSRERDYDRGNYYEIIFILANQQNLPKVALQFIKNMQLRTLYAIKSGTGQHIWTMLYSIPYKDEMFAVYMSSNQYGLIDELRVNFYDSLDTMFEVIRRAWITSFSLNGILVEGIESEAELIKSFM